MKRAHFALILLVLLSLGCATAPSEPPPEPPPSPPPKTTPEPEPPAPEPLGTAPLVGTVWELTHQYAGEELPSPSPGTVRLRFVGEGEPLLQVQGPVNQIIGRYRYTVKESKSEAPTYEEGTLSLSAVARTRKSGPYIRYEDLLVSNIGLVQGYYIRGEHPMESRLTIFGGHGGEEIILLELRVAELPSD